MPGHKGKPFLGMEAMDLTEIAGADELYHPEGIIAESESMSVINAATMGPKAAERKPSASGSVTAENAPDRRMAAKTERISIMR